MTEKSLEDLQRLRAEGVLSEEEFEAAQRRLGARKPPPPPTFDVLPARRPPSRRKLGLIAGVILVALFGGGLFLVLDRRADRNAEEEVRRAREQQADAAAAAEREEELAEAAELAQAERAEARAAEREYERCFQKVATVHGMLTSLDQQLSVSGISVDDYDRQVRTASLAYEGSGPNSAPPDCYRQVVNPLRKALNSYIDAAEFWYDCNFECSSEYLDAGLNARWKESEELVQRASRGLRKLKRGER